MSIKVLDTIVKEDDEIVESWYLLAFAFFKLKKWASALDCCKSVKDLIIKQKIHDPELEAGTLEIYTNVMKETGGDLEELDNEDDGFETMSEESGDDSDVEMKE